MGRKGGWRWVGREGGDVGREGGDGNRRVGREGGDRVEMERDGWRWRVMGRDGEGEGTGRDCKGAVEIGGEMGRGEDRKGTGREGRGVDGKGGVGVEMGRKGWR